MLKLSPDICIMMANIAEFERKQTAERISHSFLARAKRGLYNGGSVPLGYEIDKEKQGHLNVLEEEAEIVRMIFATFLKEETLVKTAKSLNDKGMILPQRMRGSGGTRASFFRMEQVRKTLRNKAYIGIRVFSDKEGNSHQVPAVWPPIIDEITFERAQKLLSSNRYHKRTHLNQRYPYTLSGFTYCAVCGDRMAGKSAHGRNGKFPYYEHSWAIKNQASLSKRLLKCEPQRVPAGIFEKAVWQEVKAFLLSPDVTQALLDTAKRLIPENKSAAEITRIKRKSQAITLQIETLTERISRLPKGMNEKPFFDQMMKLQETQSHLEFQMIELNSQLKPDDVIDLEDLMKFTASLKALIKKADQKPEIQAEILRKLVHRVEIRKDSCEAYLHVGKRYFRQEFDDKELNPSERPRGRTPYLPKFLKNNGSKRLTIGGARKARTRRRRALAEARKADPRREEPKALGSFPNPRFEDEKKPTLLTTWVSYSETKKTGN